MSGQTMEIGMSVHFRIIIRIQEFDGVSEDKN